MQYNSFADYLHSLPPNTIFRLWEYKRMFTPYEQSNMFRDESPYVSIYCDSVIIKDIIILPDGDLLLAVCRWDDEKYTFYHKLSQIKLERADKDMEEIDEFDSNGGY